MPEGETGLPGEMKERGTHLHHEEPTVMPEMFGGEKGEKYKLGPTREALRSFLGLKTVGEVGGTIKKIKSAGLKGLLNNMNEQHIEELRAPETRERLLRTNNELREWIQEGSLNEREANIARKVIAFNVRQLEKPGSPTGEIKGMGELIKETKKGRKATEEMKDTQTKIFGKEEFPEDKEEQRRFLEEKLEAIEVNDLPLASVPALFLYGRNPELAGQIMVWVESGRLDEELKKEALARLRLHHCAVVLGAVPGKVEESGDYLFKLFEPVESKKYALTGLDFEFLFQKQEIQEAWHILQRAATKGIKTEKGERRYLEKNLTPTDRRSLMNAIQEELGRKITVLPGKDKKMSAKKAFQLAERVAIATREMSVWNADLQGNDPLAEAIYFRKYRTDRAVRVRDRGPDITISRIEGFGSSFFRFTQDANTRYLNDPSLDRDGLTDLSLDPDSEKRVAKMLGLFRAPADPTGKPIISKLEGVFPEKINFADLPEGAYTMYVSGMLPRFFKAKQLLLQTTWKPDDFSSDSVESWVAPFDAIDPFQVMRLKTEFLLGAFHAIFSHPNMATDQHWDGFALKGVTSNLLRAYTTEEGQRISFISRKQLNWIKASLKRGWRLNIDHEAAMVNVRTKITKRVI